MNHYIPYILTKTAEYIFEELDTDPSSVFPNSMKNQIIVYGIIRKVVWVAKTKKGLYNLALIWQPEFFIDISFTIR